MNEYCHILNKEETKGFFDDVKEVYTMILEYASSDTKRKNHKNISEEVKEVALNNKESESAADHNHLSPDIEDPEAALNGRSSVLTTDRSLAENELLNTNSGYVDTMNASDVLNLTDTFEVEEVNSSNEDKDA